MPETKRSATDTLIAELLQNGNCIEISTRDVARYERLARAADRFKKAPAGMRVRVKRDWREHKAWVLLEDIPAWMTAVLAPIAVPATLRQSSDATESCATERISKDVMARPAGTGGIYSVALFYSPI